MNSATPFSPSCDDDTGKRWQCSQALDGSGEGLGLMEAHPRPRACRVMLRGSFLSSALKRLSFHRRLTNTLLASVLRGSPRQRTALRGKTSIHVCSSRPFHPGLLPPAPQSQNPDLWGTDSDGSWADQPRRSDGRTTKQQHSREHQTRKTRHRCESTTGDVGTRFRNKGDGPQNFQKI